MEYIHNHNTPLHMINLQKAKYFKRISKYYAWPVGNTLLIRAAEFWLKYYMGLLGVWLMY